MKVTRIPVGVLYANCYIVSAENGDTVAIDTGAEYSKILSFLKERSLTLKKILLTHGHFDHMGAAQQLSQEYGVRVYIHSLDAPMITDSRLSMADDIGGEVYRAVKNFETISDGDVIGEGELSFKVLHTPGHTKGSVCYVCGDSLFSGDTLFPMSAGRTDFPGGSLSDMFSSMKKLKELPGNYKVYPGHNLTTTLDYERHNNPYLKGNPYEDTV